MLGLQTYARLHACQREQGITGHVAEVGVYHGRSFIPLALLCGLQVWMNFMVIIESHVRYVDESSDMPQVVP